MYPNVPMLINTMIYVYASVGRGTSLKTMFRAYCSPCTKFIFLEPRSCQDLQCIYVPLHEPKHECNNK